MEDIPPIFMEIHDGLTREGPGSEECTRKAFSSIKDVPADAKILDIGCGPGEQTIHLSKLNNGHITALDYFEKYLDQLKSKITDGQNITLMKGDMFNLPFDDEAFDLIWSEGAIYIIGFEKGLKEWKRFLKPGGYLAVTHISWLKDDITAEPKAFWDAAYPDMKNIDENLEIAASCGYEVISHFTLPENAWFDVYYHDVEKRLDELSEKYKDDAEALSIFEGERQEIDLYRRYSDCYGYEFFILKKD